MKAIETVYAGYRFRSRLEARWAVFFDVLGVKYEYEKEGFDLGDAGRYLPDFWLPDYTMWIEIKAESPHEKECWKAATLADQSGQPVVILSGTPGWKGTDFFDEPTFKVDSFFGYHLPPQDIFLMAGYFGKINFVEQSLRDFLREHYPADEVPEYDGTRESIIALITHDRWYFLDKYGRDHPNWKYGISSNGGTLIWKNNRLLIDNDWHFLHPDIIPAIRAARQARFEHGESPNVLRQGTINAC